MGTKSLHRQRAPVQQRLRLNNPMAMLIKEKVDYQKWINYTDEANIISKMYQTKCSTVWLQTIGDGFNATALTIVYSFNIVKVFS
jgi:hypothetical protein